MNRDAMVKRCEALLWEESPLTSVSTPDTLVVPGLRRSVHSNQLDLFMQNSLPASADDSIFI